VSTAENPARAIRLVAYRNPTPAPRGTAGILAENVPSDVTVIYWHNVRHGEPVWPGGALTGTRGRCDGVGAPRQRLPKQPPYIRRTGSDPGGGIRAARIVRTIPIPTPTALLFIFYILHIYLQLFLITCTFI
jgi:hypothetical protein